MPRIPTRDTQTEFEQLTPESRLRSRLGDTTRKSNFTVGAANAIATVAKVEQQETDRAERVQEAEFDNFLRNKKIEMLHDKDKGFYQTKGKNAAMGEKTFTEDFKKFANEEMAKYSGGSDRLRERLNIMSSRYQTEFKGATTQHSAREYERYENDTFNARIASLHNEALLDPAKFPENVGAQKSTIDEFGKSRGWSKEKIEMAQLKSSSKAYNEFITRMVDNEMDVLAQDYFNVGIKRGEIDSETALGLEKMLKQSSTNLESQRASEAIITSNPDASLEEMKEMARQKYSNNADLQDATVKRIDRRVREKRSEDEYASRQYFEGRGDDLHTNPEAFSLGAEDFKNLSFKQQNALMNYRDRIIEAKNNKPKRKHSDLREYEKLLFMDYDDFVRYDIIGKSSNKLTVGDTQMFLKLKKDKQEHTRLVTANKYVSSVIKSRGLNEAEDLEESSQIRLQFEQELNQYPKEDRTKIEVLNKVKDTVLMEMERPGLFSFNKPFYKVRGESGIKPDQRPEGTRMPSSANFVDKVVNGRRIVGYEDEYPGGVKVYYDTNGNKIGTLKPKGR